MSFGDEAAHRYVILTHRLPMRPYEIAEGYSLRAIRPTREMIEGGPCSVYKQRMALPFVDLSSHNVYRDLVMFHSFIDDDPETYRYAEYLEQRDSRFFMDLELEYIDDVASSDVEHPYGGLCRTFCVDFDRFPAVIFWDPQDILTGTEKEEVALAIPEEWTPWTGGMQWRKDDQSAHVEIDYAVAFSLYRRLRSSDQSLRNAIDIYVFTRSLWDIAEIYRNDYMSAALYIAMLESVAQEPTWCSGTAICPTCQEIVPHRVKSLEKHFLEEHGIWFKKPRGRRHKFVHNVVRLDLPDALQEVYDKWYIDREPILDGDKRKEDELWEFRLEIEKLERVTRKRLLELFLRRYYQELDLPSQA